MKSNAILGALTIVFGIGGYVLLSATRNTAEANSLLLIIGPVVTGLFVKDTVSRRTGEIRSDIRNGAFKSGLLNALKDPEVKEAVRELVRGRHQR